MAIMDCGHCDKPHLECDSICPHCGKPQMNLIQHANKITKQLNWRHRLNKIKEYLKLFCESAYFWHVGDLK